MLRIDKSAWLLVVLSAALQILIFPLPNLYILCWMAIAPLLVALLRARQPDTLQIRAGIKLLPARPLQAFLLAYSCGVIWYAGTCYWIYNTMRQYGGVSAPAAVGILILFCLYLAIYHGVFGLLISLLAGSSPFSRRALLLAPAMWVAVELARTRITGFPWDLLGIAQVDNIPLAHVTTFTGVYGLSFEIMVVNAAMAAAFLIRREQRKFLLLAALGSAVVLQAGLWLVPPPLVTDHSARLVQENIPILQGPEWTKEYFEDTLTDLTRISLSPGPNQQRLPDLMVWPESPAPFYTTDPIFREAVSNIARKAQTWVLAGSVGTSNAGQSSQRVTQSYNSAALVNPRGEWVSRYDKMHLVPFGEYEPFPLIHQVVTSVSEEVGGFHKGTERSVGTFANGYKFSVFICYEAIYPREVRAFTDRGAQLLINISNDGWFGASAAAEQHLRMARVRAVENRRWLVRDTNSGLSASIDPYGNVTRVMGRDVRGSSDLPYDFRTDRTLYVRFDDWFAWMCVLVSAILVVITFRKDK